MDLLVERLYFVFLLVLTIASKNEALFANAFVVCDLPSSGTSNHHDVAFHRFRPTTQSFTTKVNALLAKKKKKKGGGGGGGGKKNKGNKKSGGFEWATSFTLKPYESTTMRQIASSACSSFEGRTGKPLGEELKGSSDIPKALWNSQSVACLVVGEKETQQQQQGEEDSSSPTDGGGSSVTIKYANIAALETVGLKPDQFEQFIATTDKDGNWVPPLSSTITNIDMPTTMNGGKKYESGYTKKIYRNRKNHREGGGNDDNNSSSVDITIQNSHRWTIEKSMLLDGKFVTEFIGVAYAWESWLEESRTDSDDDEDDDENAKYLCRPGGRREMQLDIDKLKEKVMAQGAYIRELKEEKGLGNKDPEVAEAVQELLGMKALLEEVS